MALNVVYLRVQGSLQQCHVSDGDMMVFNHYNSIIQEADGTAWYSKPTWYWVNRRRYHTCMMHKRELYAEKVVKSGQYLIVKGGLQCV